MAGSSAAARRSVHADGKKKKQKTKKRNINNKNIMRQSWRPSKRARTIIIIHPDRRREKYRRNTVFEIVLGEKNTGEIKKTGDDNSRG